jgi:class 3 adenylate cyclase/tetratricopeptide (TPR) repeat protein
MDVGGWLRGLGLGQYEPTFREHGIDHEVLPDLTEKDLIELGINAIGHRRKLLTAIQSAANSSLPRASTLELQRPMEHAAERRQLTVMFCDLVDSTALSVRTDPEDLSAILRAYQNTVASAAKRYDGVVARLMGDGTLVYFGYPYAHEDDAERSARAALLVIETVRDAGIEYNVSLKVRVGIATGLVVIGELMGEGEAQQLDVVGETPNLAARLQALAQPGSVLVAETTRRLIGDAFIFDALEPQTLKGFAAPVACWRVVHENAALSRFEASRSEMMTPLIGREQEVSLLLDRWHAAIDGDGQVVLLHGEAGIGKSRMLAALRERLSGTKYIPMRYQCSPFHTSDALHPIIAQVKHAAGFVDGENIESRLEKLEGIIRLSGADVGNVAPYIAKLLSIPSEDRYPTPQMTLNELKERTIAVLTDLFVGLTRTAPVLALLEDAHWCDPTTLDLIGRLVERLPSIPVLLVVTFRPDFSLQWPGRSQMTSHGLSRFGRRQVLAMIDRIAAGKSLPPEVTEQIIAKTDGVPLFVEELTKAVLESELLRESGGSYVLAQPITSLAIPSTLRDSLMARLDRLNPVKEIAQIGAAIGREFSYPVLEAVSTIKGKALQDALGQLIDSELIYARGSVPESVYVFKHALVQDAAYASMLRGKRRRVHAGIVRALTDTRTNDVEIPPAVLAHHYSEAGLYVQAIRAWLTAAELALSRSAPLEANHNVNRALSLIPLLNDETDRLPLELAAHLAHASALLQLKGYTVPDTVEALTRAKAILDGGVGTDLQRFSALYGLCAANYFAARMEVALALARELLDVVRRQSDPIYWLVAYRLLATLHVLMGRQRLALELIQEAEQHRDPEREKLLSFRFAIDPGLAVLAYKVWTLWFLGSLDQAERVRDQVSNEISTHAHSPTIATCRFVADALPELVFGDPDACVERTADLVKYASEKKVEQFRLVSAVLYASAVAMREPSKANVGELFARLEEYHESGAHVIDSIFLCLLAEILLKSGDLVGSEEVLAKAFAFVKTSGEECWLSELHRVEGHLAIRLSAPDRAADCFQRSMDVARRQEARILELRAATELASLPIELGVNTQQLLTPILSAISGGEFSRDVRRARALLAVETAE